MNALNAPDQARADSAGASIGLPAGLPLPQLRRRYITALSLIAVLVIFSQIAMQSLIVDKIQDTAALNVTQWVGWGFMIVTLIVLALEAFLVFAPTTHRLRHVSNRLTQRNQDLKHMFDASPTALVMIDMTSLTVLRANWKALELLRLDENVLQQQSLMDMLHGDYKSNRQFIDRLQTNHTLNEFEVVLLNAQASVIESLVTSRIIQFAGRYVYVLGFTDVSKLRQTRNSLEYYATYDELTGLVNRRTGLLFLEKAMARAWRDSQPLSIVFANLNGLKIANERYGQQEGDQLLRAASNIMTGLVRASDMAVRLGGDDFLIVLPNCSRQNAMRIVENLERLLLAIKHDSPRRFVYSVHCGVMTFDADRHGSPEDFIADARGTLHQPKPSVRIQ